MSDPPSSIDGRVTLHCFGRASLWNDARGITGDMPRSIVHLGTASTADLGQGLRMHRKLPPFSKTGRHPIGNRLGPHHINKSTEEHTNTSCHTLYYVVSSYNIYP